MDKLDFLEDIAEEMDRLNENLECLIEVQNKLLKEVTKLNHIPYKQ